LLPEASAHGRLGYRCGLTLPGLPFPVQVIRPAGEREAAEQQANPGMDASTLVGAFPADAARDGAVSPAQHRPLVLE
jgi:hypothetical protein